jgi:hypothetical protein
VGGVRGHGTGGSDKRRYMNGRIAKKIRKYSRRNWIEYYQAIREWPFLTRLHFCWDILFTLRWKAKNPSKLKGKINKSQVLKARRPVEELA